MNKNISEEELLLRKAARRRLLGAIVLVVAAVIILPMIFDEPKSESKQQEIAIHFPPEDIVQETPSLLPSSEELPIQDQDVYEEIDATGLVPPDSSGDTQNTQISSDDLVTYLHVPIPGIKPQLDTIETVIEKMAIVVTEGYVVQLGAFSDLLKAEQQQKNLMSNGINAYTETVKADNNQQVTRVRVGPYSTRATAEDELEKLRKLGLDGVVTSQ